MKAGPLLSEAIEILAYDNGGRLNPDFQFPNANRKAIEITEAALARLDSKKLSDILSLENLAWAKDLLHDGGEAEALDTFVAGEDTLQKAIIKYLGEPGEVAFKLLTRIFDGDLSDAITYPVIYRTTQPYTMW